jgi:tyrosyl-tRNA synthetase
MSVTDIGVRRNRLPIAVQLNTRVSLQTRNLIDDIVLREGLNIREIVEQAIAAKWGTQPTAPMTIVGE